MDSFSRSLQNPEMSKRETAQTCRVPKGAVPCRWNQTQNMALAHRLQKKRRRVGMQKEKANEKPSEVVVWSQQENVILC